MVTVYARLVAVDGQLSDNQHSAGTEKCMHHMSGLSFCSDPDPNFGFSVRS